MTTAITALPSITVQVDTIPLWTGGLGCFQADSPLASSLHQNLDNLQLASADQPLEGDNRHGLPDRELAT